jgi:hypothetical protein
MLARFLQMELGCEVAFLGIQPADTTLGVGVSAAVKTAVATLIQTISMTYMEPSPQISQQPSFCRGDGSFE